jgi:hypothetical protein
MKKIILFTIFFFNLLPSINRGLIGINGPEKSQAQDMTVEEDTDGNYYFPIYGGDLPPDDGSVVQTGQMCVLEGMQVVANYYGLSMDAFDLAGDYSAYRHDVVGSDLSETDIINSTGVYTSDLEGFLSTKFDVNEISDSFELMNDLAENNAVMGTFDLDGVHGHEVVVVSCDLAGQVEYFDPATGYYGKCDSGDFSKLLEVTPKSP